MGDNAPHTPTPFKNALEKFGSRPLVSEYILFILLKGIVINRWYVLESPMPYQQDTFLRNKQTTLGL